MTKAIVLFSGGLDSLLTVRILQEQGILVIGLNIVTPFYDGVQSAIERADELSIPLIIHRFGDDYMRMLKNPRYGYGKAINPCLDCRTMMVRIAGEWMTRLNADFVATGEIAGQRPNSQKIHQLNLIARDSGLEDRLLRPLSAKVLKSTLPEKEGLVDRERLHSFTGRFRGGLIRMAKNKFDLNVIPQPSTGCRLTEKSAVPQIHDLLNYKGSPNAWDAKLLSAGRQFRIDPATKCVLGRRASDCQRLIELYEQQDRSPSILLISENFSGPVAVLVNDKFDDSYESSADFTPELKQYLSLAGALILHYTNENKYREIANGPTALLKMGKKEELIPLVPDPTVASFRPLQEF